MAVMSIVGLLLVLIGWIVQGYRVYGTKSSHLNLDFVVLYVIGIVLIALEGFSNGAVVESIINVVVAVVALAVGISAFMKVK